MTDTELHTVYMPMVKRARPGIPLGVAVWSACLDSPAYTTVLSNYQQITPEAELSYWYVYGPNYGGPHGWDGMDRLYQYARTWGMEIFGHCLRWCWDVQPPDVEAWITEAMTRYPEIFAWNVVNEGYNCYDGSDTIPMIQESFEIARKVRPDAQLWYNGLLFDPLEQSMVMSLIDLGLCDAVGIQMHHGLETDITRYSPFAEWLVANRIPWAVTEYDCIIPNTLPETLQLQANRYREAAQFCLDYGAEWFGVWGVADCVSWLRECYPLPFDWSYSPKAAWAAIQNTLRQ